MHDFADPELGEYAKAIPYGVYDVFNNEGWVNVGDTADTAAFAVESIRRWWYQIGQVRFVSSSPIAHNNIAGQRGLARDLSVPRRWMYTTMYATPAIFHGRGPTLMAARRMNGDCSIHQRKSDSRWFGTILRGDELDRLPIPGKSLTRPL